MKKQLIFIASIITIALFLSSVTMFAQDKKDTTIKEIKIKTSSQCVLCKKAIEKAVNKLSGIKYADLDIPSHVLTVKYNTNKVNPDEIRQAVSKAGYDADSVPADKSAYRKLPACCQKGGH
jgi:periplasmic mercuric ion binding protein